MIMECIPAIDLKGGKCVRLTQGKFEQQNLYSDDPLTIAKRWVTEGATRLHIIDLDGARTGMPSLQHLNIVRDIIRRLKIRVQLGGGMRSREVVERVLNSTGVDRVILGTSAVADPLIGEIFRNYQDKIVVGIDATDGMVAVQGWAQTTTFAAIEFAQEMEKRGAKRIIFTDIARDGMLQGVNVAAVQSIIKAVGIPVIAAGGVTTVQDIQDLSAIGAEGAILGKTLYENLLRLPDALAAAQGHQTAGDQPGFAPSPIDGTAAPDPAKSRPRTADDQAPSTVSKPYLPWMNNPPKS
jgi:phosphoribosylformimino-5-aminoimidazole carboxamide ribotide isomerase